MDFVPAATLTYWLLAESEEEREERWDERRKVVQLIIRSWGWENHLKDDSLAKRWDASSSLVAMLCCTHIFISISVCLCMVFVLLLPMAGNGKRGKRIERREWWSKHDITKPWESGGDGEKVGIERRSERNGCPDSRSVGKTKQNVYTIISVDSFPSPILKPLVQSTPGAGWVEEIAKARECFFTKDRRGTDLRRQNTSHVPCILYAVLLSSSTRKPQNFSYKRRRFNATRTRVSKWGKKESESVCRW